MYSFFNSASLEVFAANRLIISILTFKYGELSRLKIYPTKDLLIGGYLLRNDL